MDGWFSSHLKIYNLQQNVDDRNVKLFHSRLVYVTDQDSELVTALGTATRLSCATSAINAVLEFTLQVDNADVISDVYCLWSELQLQLHTIVLSLFLKRIKLR